MIIKIVIYLLIILGVFISEYFFGGLEYIGISKGPFVSIILFSVYLLMLYMEIHSLYKAKKYHKAKRSGFMFSFWIGMMWGGMISLSHGYSYLKDFRFADLPLSILALCLVGAVFGFLGTLITNMILKFMKGSGLEETESE